MDSKCGSHHQSHNFLLYERFPSKKMQEEWLFHPIEVPTNNETNNFDKYHREAQNAVQKWKWLPKKKQKKKPRTPLCTIITTSKWEDGADLELCQLFLYSGTKQQCAHTALVPLQLQVTLVVQDTMCDSAQLPQHVFCWCCEDGTDEASTCLCTHTKIV